MTILDILLERKTSLQLATESLWIVITWILLLFILLYKITTVLCDTLQLLCTADFDHLQIFLHPDIAKGPPNPSIIFLSLKLCFSCVSGLLTIFHPSRTRLLICEIMHVLWVKNICYVCNQKNVKMSLVPASIMNTNSANNNRVDATALYFSVVGVNFCETMFHCAPFFGKMADFLGKWAPTFYFWGIFPTNAVKTIFERFREIILNLMRSPKFVRRVRDVNL